MAQGSFRLDQEDRRRQETELGTDGRGLGKVQGSYRSRREDMGGEQEHERRARLSREKGATAVALAAEERAEEARLEVEAADRRRSRRMVEERMSQRQAVLEQAAVQREQEIMRRSSSGRVEQTRYITDQEERDILIPI